MAQQDKLDDAACDLEWKIAFAEVDSPQGYAAKITAIREANFDNEDLIAIAFMLGRQAERLGIAGGAPELRGVAAR
jgi:hypothetical protein